MATQKRKMDDRESEASTIERLRSGELHILSAITEELPDVFTVDILPKLDAKATFNLAQVNKWYNDAVWSVCGVRSMRAKLENCFQTPDTQHLTEPLYWAATIGNLPMLRALMKSGVDVQKELLWRLGNLKIWCSRDDERLSRFTALHMACQGGHLMVVKALIDAGADVNCRRNMAGIPPLLFAAGLGHAPVVLALIKAGADVNLADAAGRVPLLLAAEAGNVKCVSLLIYAGVNIRYVHPGSGGDTALTCAKDNENAAVVKLLKKAACRECRIQWHRLQHAVGMCAAPTFGEFGCLGSI